MIDRIWLKDLLVETAFALASLALGAFLLAFLALAFIFPFHNYHTTSGVVEYDKEIPLSMEAGGVIYRILVLPHEKVRAGQPVVELLNQGNRQEVAALDYRLELKRQEIERARRLYQLGAVEGSLVRQRETEEKELSFQRKKMLTNIVKAPYDGHVYFTSSPQMLVGSFLHQGQVVAFLYRDGVKGVRIRESSLLADRLNAEAAVKVYLENTEVRHPQIRGRVSEKVIDRSQNILSLYCGITRSGEFFDSLPAGSSVKVSILLGSKSLFESFFDVDLYGPMKRRFGSAAFDRVERWLN